MLCPNCKTRNRDGAKFCDECGFPLVGLADDGEDAAEGQRDEPEEPEGEPSAHEGSAPEASEDEGSDPRTFDTQELYEIDLALDAGEEPLEETASADDAGDPQAPAGGSTDFSGLDISADEYGERIADPSIEIPEPNWRDGDTVQMEPVGGDEREKSRDYLASSTRKQGKGKKIAIGIVVAAIVIAAAAALVTFQMHLWGGKTVPDVHGMTEADATSVLEGEGFTVRSSQVKSDDTEGLVLISDPEAGSRADEGSEVLIHIATARTIPADLVGMTEAQAAEALAAEGFENVRFEKESSDEPAGQVLSVSPEAGSRAKSAAEIVVKVAEPFVVPDVSGMYLDDAIQALQDAGYDYDVLYIVSDSYPDGMMLGTSPAAGSEVPGGSLVYIQISQARGTQLENLARSALAPGSSVIVNGNSFIIDSLDSVSYVGNGTVSYTATGRAYTTLAGETVYGSPTTFTSILTFDDDNALVG